MDGLLLRSEQIEAGALTLNQTTKKLKSPQVDDLVAIFRWFLGSLASKYTLRATFEGLTDDAESNKCAKLAACLIAWQDYQFDTGGFAATAANREGFNFQIERAKYNIFQYAFTLFWDLPPELESIYIFGGNGNRKSSQGSVLKSL